MKSDQWPGLVTNASPFAIPPTAAVEQLNLASHVPGQVSVRGGMQKVNVVGGASSILDCYPCELDGKQVVVAMKPDGSLVALESPAYGWKYNVPYEPRMESSALLTSSYTYQYVASGDPDYAPPEPDVDPGYGGGEDEGCDASLNGGASDSALWDFFLDAASCETSSSDSSASGGTASAIPDCDTDVSGTLCEDDPLPPPEATVPTPPRDLTVTFGLGSAGLAWVAPVSDGGSPVLDYEWSLSTGNDEPSPLPSAPTITSVVWGETSATVTWAPTGTVAAIDYDFVSQTAT